MEASGLIPVVAIFIPSKVPPGGWIILKIGMQSKRIAYYAPKNVYARHNSVCQVTLNIGSVVVYGVFSRTSSYCVYGKENSGNENGRLAPCCCLNNQLIPEISSYFYWSC